MMSSMPIVRRLCAVAFTAAAVGLAGCSHDDSSANQPPTVVTNTVPVAVPSGTTTVTTTPNGSSAVATTASGTTAVSMPPQTNNTNAGPGGATGADSATGDAVLKTIHTNVQLTGSRILATADASGVVRLTGTAQNQQQKALAERLARNTAGVTSVVNKIEIVATGGVKSPPVTKVVEKTKIVVVHDKAPAADGSTTPPPAPDNAAPAAPADGSSPTTAPPPTSSGM